MSTTYNPHSKLNILFTFLFVIGGLMFVIASYFPLQNQYELKIEANEFYLDSTLASNRIIETKIQKDRLKKIYVRVNLKLDSLTENYLSTTLDSEKDSISKEAHKLKDIYDKSYQYAFEFFEDNKADQIKLEFSGKARMALLDQISTYKIYSKRLEWCGAIFFIIGLIGIRTLKKKSTT